MTASRSQHVHSAAGARWLPALVVVLGLGGCAALDRQDTTAPPADSGVSPVAQLLDSAEGHLAAGDLAAAADDLAQARQLAPENTDVLVSLAGLSVEQGDLGAALGWYQQAVAAAAASGDVDGAAFYNELIGELALRPPVWAEETTAMAMGLAEEQDVLDSFTAWEELRGEAVAAFDAGDLDSALGLAEMALDLAEEAFGELHYLTIVSVQDMANYAYAAGDGVGAETLLLLGIQKASDGLGPDHPDTLDQQGILADLYEEVGQLEEALGVHAERRAVLLDAWGQDHPRTIAAARDQARVLDALGDFEAAANLLEATCTGYAASYGPLHPETARCQEQIGVLLAREGDLTGATQAWAEALNIHATLGGTGSADSLVARGQLAELQRRQGDLAGARAELETALDAAAASGDPDVVVELTALLARVEEDLGNFEVALELNEAVYAERVAVYGEDHPATLAALNFVGGTLLRVGRLAEAEEAWRAALDGYAAIYGERNLNTVSVMNNLGVVLEKQGLYDQAEPVLRDALDISEDLLGSAHPTTIRNMNNLALLHEAQGNFDRAEPLYLLPVEILTADLGPDHPDTIAVINNLAFLYMLEEDWVRAEEMFRRVRDSWSVTLGLDHQNTLKASNNLARSLVGQQRFAEAEPLFLDTLARRQAALGPEHIDVQRSMHDLGALYLAVDRLDEAEALLRNTLELNESTLGEQHPYTFETLNTLAETIEARGALAQAFQVRRDIFTRRTEFLDRMLWVTSTNAREGYVRLHRPELDAYMANLAELPPEEAGAALVEVALKRKGLLLQIAGEIQQINALELDPALTELVDELRAVREELAALTLSGPTDGDGDAHVAAIADLEERVENLEGEIGRESALYREKIVEATLDDLVANMADGAALIEFMVYSAGDDKRLAAGVLRNDGGSAATAFVDYGSYARTTSLIEEYRELIQDPDADDDEVLDLGMIVYETLWTPLEEHLVDATPVYFVPDGLLNILPFEALLNPDGDYLLQTTDLRMLSSSRDLLPSNIPEATGPMLVMAGPDYDTEDAAGVEVLAAARSRAATRSATRSVEAVDDPAADSAPATSRGLAGRRSARAEQLRGISLDALDSRSALVQASLRAASQGMRGLRFSPLPGAEREGELIVQEIDEALIPNVIVSRREAEERVLMTLAQPPSVLHVATHGFFLKPDEGLRRRLLKMQRSAEGQLPPPGDNPLLRAGLAFAGINSNAPFLGEIDTTNDGVLTALEVLGLNLSGTRMAVLSACETGLGQISEGEGVYGLRRAFREAGVQQIVMSLWEVSDAGTQALMTAMYDRLLAGDDPRTALRGAQREMLEDPRWGYPYIWAAFTVVGK